MLRKVFRIRKVFFTGKAINQTPTFRTQKVMRVTTSQKTPKGTGLILGKGEFPEIILKPRLWQPNGTEERDGHAPATTAQTWSFQIHFSDPGANCEFSTNLVSVS